MDGGSEESAPMRSYSAISAGEPGEPQPAAAISVAEEGEGPRGHTRAALLTFLVWATVGAVVVMRRTPASGLGGGSRSVSSLHAAGARPRVAPALKDDAAQRAGDAAARNAELAPAQSPRSSETATPKPTWWTKDHTHASRPTQSESGDDDDANRADSSRQGGEGWGGGGTWSPTSAFDHLNQGPAPTAIAQLSRCGGSSGSGSVGNDCVLPTQFPSAITAYPTPTPSANFPSPVPSAVPTPSPSQVPTPTPTPPPSQLPSPKPSATPTPRPSEVPTPAPSETPTPVPTPRPTLLPYPVPTSMPTFKPTNSPIEPFKPTFPPTTIPPPVETPIPTNLPSLRPTHPPYPTPKPSAECRRTDGCHTPSPSLTPKPTRYRDRGEPSKGGGKSTEGNTDDNIHWGEDSEQEQQKQQQQ